MKIRKHQKTRTLKRIFINDNTYDFQLSEHYKELIENNTQKDIKWEYPNLYNWLFQIFPDRIYKNKILRMIIKWIIAGVGVFITALITDLVTNNKLSNLILRLLHSK